MSVDRLGPARLVFWGAAYVGGDGEVYESTRHSRPERSTSADMKSMIDTKYEITIASVTDRGELVAEIWVDDLLFSEIRKEEVSAVVEVYSRPDGMPWVFECDRLSAILSEAKAKLPIE